MCSTAVSGLIFDIVTERVNGGEMFTAYDITLAVQDRLKKDNAFDPTQHRHRHLRNDVHREISTYLTSNVYNRTLQDVGAPTPAFVYHPPGSDPSTYTPRLQHDTPQPATPSQVAYTPPTSPVASQFNSLSTDDEGDAQDTTGRTPDARGTLTVPVPVLAAAGINPLETVYASPTQYNSKDAVALSKQPFVGATGPVDPATTYTVDSHGNVRITQHTLQKCNINGGGKTYDFRADGSVVYITLH